MQEWVSLLGYAAQVDGPGGQADARSVFHRFASLVEARAYLAGAGVEWSIVEDLRLELVVDRREIRPSSKT